MQNSTTAFTIVQFPVVVRVQRYFTTVYSIFPVSTHLPIKGASIDFAFSLSRLPLFSQKPSTFTVRSRAFASAAAPPAVVPASPSDTFAFSSARHASSQRVKCLFKKKKNVAFFFSTESLVFLPPEVRAHSGHSESLWSRLQLSIATTLLLLLLVVVVLLLLLCCF